MSVSTIHLSAACWRLLNALERVNGPARMLTIGNEQDATDDDVVLLERAGLIAGAWYGTTTPLSIAEHLAHHGTTMMVHLRLTTAGRRQLAAPRNQVLVLLGRRSRRPLRLHNVVRKVPGADVVLFERMTSLRLVSAVHTETGQPVELAGLSRTPQSHIAVRLTDKGRIFLPL